MAARRRNREVLEVTPPISDLTGSSTDCALVSFWICRGSGGGVVVGVDDDVVREEEEGAAAAAAEAGAS